jgi:hypothetical protein
MKHVLSCLLVLALAGLTRADEAEAKAEAQVKSLLDVMNKSIAILEGIKDKAGAEKAKPELEKLFEKMEQAGKEFAKVPAAVKEKLEEVYKPQFKVLQPRYRKEVERLRKDEAVTKVLGELGPFKAMGREREILARYKALLLERAVQAYQLKHNKLPDSLEALAEGDKPFVEKSALKDPWGKPFQYDPKGPRNKGLKPDIWTSHPSGKLFGNWAEKPAPKDK